jgi:multidrug resistance efflux pump
MKNIAYWMTLLAAALSLAMFVYSPSIGDDSCSVGNASPNTKVTNIDSRFASAASSGSSLTDEHIGKVESSTNSRVSRILAADSSFVVRGQLLYILDDSDIWSKIVVVNDRLRTEMQMADIYYLKNTGADAAYVSFATSRRRIQDLNNLRNDLYRELSKTRIRAPFTGTLESSKVKLGDTVYTGQLLNGIIKYNTSDTGRRTELASEPLRCAARRFLRI